MGMLTMKRARQMAPADPERAKYEVVPAKEGGERRRIVQARTLVTSFRQWARGQFAGRRDLSPKLERIVHEASR